MAIRMPALSISPRLLSERWPTIWSRRSLASSCATGDGINADMLLRNKVEVELEVSAAPCVKTPSSISSPSPKSIKASTDARTLMIPVRSN